MGKVTRACSFTNAILSFDGAVWEITEIEKDDIKTFRMDDVLNMFKNVEGVSLTIKQVAPVTPVQTETKGEGEV